MFADADGASLFEDTAALFEALKKVGVFFGECVFILTSAQVERDGFGVAVGSRNHLVRKAVASVRDRSHFLKKNTSQSDLFASQRKWYRNVLMHGFHFAVWLLAVRSVKDTQCGFKLFTRRAAQVLFPSQVRFPFVVVVFCFDG
jgi:dolichyl-phosphate beta-glucosyltransferase